MNAYRQISSLIHIDAPVGDVWAVFVNPAVSIRLGGEYITDWTIGSPIEWKEQNGFTQSKGVILEMLPHELLKIQLEDLSFPDKILSTITFEFEDFQSFTKLAVEEVIHCRISNDEYHDACQRWKDLLFQIAEVAEKIRQQ